MGKGRGGDREKGKGAHTCTCVGHSECVQVKQGSPTALDLIFSFHRVSPRK